MVIHLPMRIQIKIGIYHVEEKAAVGRPHV